MSCISPYLRTTHYKRLFELVNSLVPNRVGWERYRRFCVAVIGFMDVVGRTNKCSIDWVGARVGTDVVSVFYERNQYVSESSFKFEKQYGTFFPSSCCFHRHLRCLPHYPFPPRLFLLAPSPGCKRSHTIRVDCGADIVTRASHSVSGIKRSQSRYPYHGPVYNLDLSR